MLTDVDIFYLCCIIKYFFCATHYLSVNLKETKKQNMILTQAHHDHEKGLTMYASYKTSNSNTGKDLVKDTFMKTWAYLLKGGKIEKMRAFLYHILNNLIVDQYRKHKTTSLDVLIEKSYEPSVDDSMLGSIDGKTAQILIEQLPKIYRDILYMKYVQDRSLAEIATITGQSKTTIAVQMHRGIGQLKILYSAQKVSSDEEKQ